MTSEERFEIAKKQARVSMQMEGYDLSDYVPSDEMLKCIACMVGEKYAHR